MQKSKNSFLIYFGLSMLLHFCILSVCFYQKHNRVYFQVPIDVEFYSPIEDIVNKNTENKIDQQEQRIIEEIKPKVVDKNVIALKKTKKQNNKKDKKQKKKEVEKVKETKKNIEPKKVQQEVPKENIRSQQNVASTQSTSVGVGANKSIMFENADFRYSYYTVAIVKKISRYWQWANNYAACRAVVYFKIDRDGFVKEVRIKESSGNEDFDQNAIRAIELSSPFAPLPEEYKQDNLGVYFEFKLK